jgi:uncharacterized alpha-E superfamily protein
LLDESNPRSLAFGLVEIVNHTVALPNPHAEGQTTPSTNIARALVGEVRLLEPDSITNDQILGIENELMRLSIELSHCYFTSRELTVGDGANE